MKEELKDKHAHEWEVFNALSVLALNELIEEEISVHQQYGMLSDHLPQEWRNKLQQNRQSWLDKWGGQGRQAAEIKTRQNEEVEDYEAGIMFGYIFRQEQADEKLKEEISSAIEEKDAVTSYYEMKDYPVPNATQKRFAKRFLELQDRYDGKEYQTRSTLDDHDLRNEAESWNDLIKQHEIIRMHYQRAEYIPEPSIAQMQKDVRDFNAEQMTYRQTNNAQVKNAQVKADADPAMTDERNGFKEHLKTIHDRSQQQPRLRP